MAQRSQESLELLLEVSLLLSSKLDISELLETIMQLASRVVNAETASLLLVDPKTNELYFDVALGLDPALTKIRLKMGQGIAGTCALEAKTSIINDVRKDPRWSPAMDKNSGFVTRSILASPMKIKGRVIGVVEAINRRDGGFTDDDVRLFEAFASQAAVAVDNARLFFSLKEEKARLNTVFSEMTDGAVLADEEGYITLANHAATKALGVKEGDSLPAALAGFESKPSLADIFLSKEAQHPFEATRQNPRLLILAGTAAYVHFEQIGSLPPSGGRLLVFRDVTAIRQEEALKRSFLSLISHKLKTPLASITGYSQLLLDEMEDKGFPNLLLKAVKAIWTQGNRLAEHVDKLLNYTVLEELKAEDMNLQPVAPDALVQETLNSMKTWLEDHKGQVNVKGAGAPPIHGDPMLLRGVMKNLIENGVKFGGGQAIDIWYEGDEESIILHVRDSGPGIPPEECAKVFDRFYQSEASFTGQIEGWGLGLPFVKKVVEQHGGTVKLDSTVGQGTTVRVKLPKSSGHPENPAAE